MIEAIDKVLVGLWSGVKNVAMGFVGIAMLFLWLWVAVGLVKFIWNLWP